MRINDWDKVSKNFLRFWLVMFFVGLILGYFLSFATQCIIMGVLYVIVSILFLTSEFGHAGILSAITFSALALWSLALGFIIIDVLLLIS